MGKSGKINRAEPSDLTWVQKLPDCAEMFQQAGWLSFFKKIEGFNSKVSCKFAKALKEDMIMMDALKFKLTVELISEATEIKNEGEHWFKKSPFEFDPHRYLLPNVIPNWSKGIPIQSFRKEWIEPLRILQSYVTCEGRYSFVFKYHFRFLQHLVGVSRMNLPFFFLKSLQKMASKIKEQDDHTSQSLFHHGLIKLIISTVLQQEGRNWDFFLFWSDIHPKKEDQQPKRQSDKGKVMIKKLGHSITSTSKGEIKVKKVTEQVSEHAQGDSQFSGDSKHSKAKYTLFADKEVQPDLTIDMEKTVTLEQTGTVEMEKASIFKEELQDKPRSPLTIISEDEGYLLEDEQQDIITESSTEALENLPTVKSKSVKPKRKKREIVTSNRRLRTRSTNKFRWNMKKLLNPKLDSKQGAVLISSSSSERVESFQHDSKSQKRTSVEPFSSSKPASTEKAQLVNEAGQPVLSLSEIIAEIRDKTIKQKEEEEAYLLDFAKQGWNEEDEAILKQAGIIEEAVVQVDYSDILMQEPNVPDSPTEEESLQGRIQIYKEQMKQLQETNNNLLKVNKKQMDELLDVHQHFAQLSEVSREVLKGKLATDRYIMKLEETIEQLQQENEALHQKMSRLEEKHGKARKRTRRLDGIDLLVKASKKL